MSPYVETVGEWIGFVTDQKNKNRTNLKQNRREQKEHQSHTNRIELIHNLNINGGCILILTFTWCVCVVYYVQNISRQFIADQLMIDKIKYIKPIQGDAAKSSNDTIQDLKA